MTLKKYVVVASAAQEFLSVWKYESAGQTKNPEGSG
jgi:hypothetical protein